MDSKEEKKLKWLKKPLTEKEKIAILKRNNKKCKGIFDEENCE